MSEPFTLAHLSDVHLSPLTGFTPHHWNAKRALGFVNWQRKRRHIHVRHVADRLIADIKARQPEHIAVTGDLINIGLPAEYKAAAAWLASVGAPAEVSLVPGNHDIYTRLHSEPGIGRWSAYMTSDGQQGSGPAFPYVRRVGPIAIIGLCSAVPTPPGIATGHLGAAQLSAASAILGQLGQEGVFRLVLIHHPPLPGQARKHHDLLDAADLAQIFATAGAELVLHGHNHRPMAERIVWSGGHGHVLGVPSASAARMRGHEPLARYNLLRIEGRPGNWHIELHERGLLSEDGPIVDIGGRTLD